jgi:acetylornithine/N-succinyldiaminopimelate aminotransferase
MLGIVCNAEAGTVNTDVIAKLREHGLLTVGAAENVIRLLPPLTIEDAHVDEALSILETVAREVEEARDAA